MAATAMAERPPVIIHADDTERRRNSTNDPLEFAIRPPANETAMQKEERLKAEARAKKISDDIDEQIKLERAALKKRKEVKVLLLGQSESGKSTTLKQFQILHTPSQFHAECAAWRSVIYLNLVRSIRRILQALDAEEEEIQPASSDALSNAEFKQLRLRLTPVRVVEEDLIKQLAAADDNEAVRLNTLNAMLDGSKAAKDSKELSVRTSNNWKKAFARRKSQETVTEDTPWWSDPKDPVHAINALCDDMASLWAHPTVKSVLKRRRIRLEESSGFYLDDIARITAKRYIPSEDDVLKARLKTVGVVEHVFTLDKGATFPDDGVAMKPRKPGHEKGVDWKIFDVGGARSQRQFWAPYFTEVDAIIFLAPISAFDQVLTEDPNINRMEDSLLLWRTVVTNKLLEHVNIVLFLNKLDLLELKIAQGVQLKQYMTSYGDRNNDVESVSRYFRNKFASLHQSFSSNQKREVYIHLTSVTDTRKTSSVIANVRDIILRKNLEGSRLI